MSTAVLVPQRSEEYVLAVAQSPCLRCKSDRDPECGYRCNVGGTRVTICGPCMASFLRGEWFVAESGQIQ